MTEARKYFEENKCFFEIKDEIDGEDYTPYDKIEKLIQIAFIEGWLDQERRYASTRRYQFGNREVYEQEYHPLGVKHTTTKEPLTIIDRMKAQQEFKALLIKKIIDG